MLHVLFSVYLKMLVLYSPFFVLSCFISLTRGYSSKERRRLAWKVALATLVSSVLLYLFGRRMTQVGIKAVDLAAALAEDGRRAKSVRFRSAFGDTWDGNGAIPQWLSNAVSAGTASGSRQTLTA